MGLPKYVCCAIFFSNFLGAQGIVLEKSVRERVAEIEVAGFANALASLAGPQRDGSRGMLLTPEQRAKRLTELRSKIKDNMKMTQAEAKDMLLEYLLLRFSELFQELANILGDAVAKVANNKNAGDAVKRLPGAFVDGFYLTAHLVKTLANQEYVRSLQDILRSIKCLLNKSDRSGANCANLNTVNKALASVLQQSSKFLLPIAQGLVLGVTVGDRKVKGIVPLGVGVIAPGSPVEKEMDTITDLINNFLNLTDQLNLAIKK